MDSNTIIVNKASAQYAQAVRSGMSILQEAKLAQLQEPVIVEKYGTSNWCSIL